MADQRQRSNPRRAGSARGRFLLGAFIVLVVLLLTSPVTAQAQVPTTTAEPAVAAGNDGFFADFGIGDLLQVLTLGGVGFLAVWLFRVRNAQMNLKEEVVRAVKEENERERRHTEQLRERHAAEQDQHAAVIDVLERQVELYKNQAGIESGQIPPAGSQLPEDARADLSRILTVLEEMKDARQEEEPATAPSPGAAAEEHLNAGNAYFAAAEYEKALGEYSRSLELRPDDPDALNNRGIALGELGRNDAALADYTRSLELRPDDPGTLSNRGVALRRLGRDNDALAAHNRSLDLRPDNPRTLTNRGVALSVLGHPEDALADFTRSLELRPDDPNTIYSRACMYALRNDTEQAIEDLRRAIAGDATLGNRARTEGYFDNIREDPRFQELVGEDEPEQEEPSPQDGGSE